MAARTISVRLTLAEADTFRAGMRAAGADGAAALKSISDASGQVGGSLSDATGKVTGFGRAANDTGAAAASLGAKIDALRGQYLALAQASAAASAAQGQKTANQFASFQTPNFKAQGDVYKQRADDLNAAFAAGDKLRASLVPLAAAEQAHAEQVSRISTAEKSGVITTTEAAAARARAGATFAAQKKAIDESTSAQNESTRAGKLQSYQLIEIAESAHKFGDAILSGGSAMKAFAYEAPNAIAIAGGFGNAMSAVVSVITPFRVAAVLAAGGVTAMIVAAETADKRIIGLRNSLRAYTDDYSTLADRVNKSSVDQARRTGDGRADIAKAQTTVLDAAPYLSDAETQKAVDLGRALSKTMGTDLADAMKTVAQIAKDPTAAIKQLSEQGYRGLSAELVRNIDLMQRSGQTALAAKVGMDALNSAVGGANDDETAMTRAVKSLTSEWDTLWDHIGRGVAGPGATLLGWLANTLSAVNHFHEPPPAGSLNVTTGDSYRNAGSTDFKTALAQQESRGNPTIVNSLGYTGLYQQGSARLADLGLYTPAPSESLKSNQWQGSSIYRDFPE